MTDPKLTLQLTNGQLIQYKDEYLRHNVTDGGVLTIETKPTNSLGHGVQTTKYGPAAWHSISFTAYATPSQTTGFLGAPSKTVQL